MFYLQYAFNLFSHNAPILSSGYNEEEMKLVKETRKIWVSLKDYFFYYTLISNKIYYCLVLYKMVPFLFYFYQCFRMTRMLKSRLHVYVFLSCVHMLKVSIFNFSSPLMRYVAHLTNTNLALWKFLFCF